MSDQLDFLEILKSRSTPIIKSGVSHSIGSGYATLDKSGKSIFADPKSEKIESDDAQMRHRFRISTTAEDRMGDIIRPKGCERYLERYEKNNVVFLNHSSYSLPIARSESPSGG